MKIKKIMLFPIIILILSLGLLSCSKSNNTKTELKNNDFNASQIKTAESVNDNSTESSEITSAKTEIVKVRKADVASVKKNKPVIEILYMNHGPVQPVLKELRKQFSPIENDIIVKWYDFEKDIEFKEKKGIDSHLPIAIWVDNSNTIDVNGSQIKLIGFPKGQGPEFARGSWEISDLINAIKKAIGTN